MSARKDATPAREANTRTIPIQKAAFQGKPLLIRLDYSP